MKVRSERFALVAVIAIAIAGFGAFLLRESGTVARSSADSGVDAVRVEPGTDPETLPPILRSRAAREARGEAGPVDAGIRSPIELELTLLGTTGDEDGGSATVGVRVKPLIDVPDLHWFVQLPEGLTLTSGAASWRGGLTKGEEESFQFDVTVPDGRRYELYGRAEAVLESGVVTSGAGLRIDLGAPEPGANPAFERVGPDGRRVITYKGRSEEGGE